MHTEDDPMMEMIDEMAEAHVTTSTATPDWWTDADAIDARVSEHPLAFIEHILVLKGRGIEPSAEITTGLQHAAMLCQIGFLVNEGLDVDTAIGTFYRDEEPRPFTVRFAIDGGDLMVEVTFTDVEPEPDDTHADDATIEIEAVL